MLVLPLIVTPDDGEGGAAWSLSLPSLPLKLPKSHQGLLVAGTKKPVLMCVCLVSQKGKEESLEGRKHQRVI